MHAHPDLLIALKRFGAVSESGPVGSHESVQNLGEAPSPITTLIDVWNMDATIFSDICGSAPQVESSSVLHSHS
jgi:hypothetical protein